MLDTPLVLAFIEFLKLSDLPSWFRVTLQLITLWASLLLLFFMVRYDKRTILDTSLLLRELAFAILILRLTLLNVLGITSIYLTNSSYVFLAVSCVLVVYSVIKARTSMYLNHYKDE